MLDIDKLRGMSQQEQLEAAAKYANVPVGILSGIWTQESGRGTHPTMVGPDTKWGTAKGHFQILDHVNATLEKRYKRPLDRFDFTDALAGAAELMRENKAKFGTDEGAVQAYHGGWSQDNWGPKTQEYLTKVLGYAGESPRNHAVPGSLAASRRTSPTFEQFMNNPRVLATPTEDEPATVGTPFTQLQDVGPGRSIIDQSFERVSGYQQKEEAARQSQSFMELTKAHYQSMTGGLDRIIRDWGNEADPAYMDTIAADPSIALQGLANPTMEDQADLLGTTSTIDRINTLDDIRRRRAHEETMGRAGFASNLIAGGVASFADPTMWATGLGPGLALKAGRVGSLALAQSGRAGAATASALAESVAGNVSWDLLQESMGERRYAGDYAISAITGLIPGVLQAPFLFKAANVGKLQQEANAIIERRQGYIVKAMEELGADADPAKIKARGAELEAEAIRAENTARAGAGVLDKDKLNAPDIESDEYRATLPPEAADDLSAMDASAPLSRYYDPEVDVIADTRLETTLADRDSRFKPDQVRALPAGIHLDTGVADIPKMVPVITSLTELAAKYLPDTAIIVNAVKDAKFEGRATLLGHNRMMIQINTKSGSVDTAIHELGHGIWMMYARKLAVQSPELRKALEDSWRAWNARMDAGDKGVLAQRTGISRAVTAEYTALGDAIRSLSDAKDWQAGIREAMPKRGEAQEYERYFRNFDEFGAEQFVKHIEAGIVAKMEAGKKLTPGEKALYALGQIVKFMTDLWNTLRNANILNPEESFKEFFERVASGDYRYNKKGADGAIVETFLDPDLVLPDLEMAVPRVDPLDVRYGLDTLPASTPLERAEKKFIREQLAWAEAWVKENPLDPERLKTVMNNSIVNLATPATLLASSGHPLAQALSGILVEHTMGAAGRRVTAAIVKYQVKGEILGNTLLHYSSAYGAWRDKVAGKAKGVYSDLTDASLQQKFNEAVYMERERRWLGGDKYKAENLDPHVKQAADSLDAAYDRSRNIQVDRKTPGWSVLPESSVGYAPRLSNKGWFMQASNAQINAFKDMIRRQLDDITDQWDEGFKDRFAGIYTSHIRTNAMGGHEIPTNMRDGSAIMHVKEALKAMGLEKDEIEKMGKRMAAGGASHTKQRLNFNTLDAVTLEDGTVFRMMDAMETDQIALLRRQTERVSGDAGLVSVGIQGVPALKMLRRALEFWPTQVDPKVKARTIQAFDQVASELSGHPVGDGTPAWAEGLMTLAATANLGGVAFPQLSEPIVGLFALGISHMLDFAKSTPRLFKEVGMLAKGQKVEGILSSLEPMGGGGEFGMDGYKLIMNYDSPSAQYTTVGHAGMTAAQRVVHRLGHSLGIVSALRRVEAVQRRGIAEQITRKAIRFIRDGGSGKALADMGITPDLAAGLKAEMNNFVVWNGDAIQSLDMRKASPELAGAFTAAVHRGAGQIIQKSFIGEIGHWQHSTFGKMLSQYRTFPILAMEKQWGRNRGMNGAATAMAMVMAAVPFALPIALARIAVNSMAKDDPQAYMDEMMHPAALARYTMNYMSMTGLLPDLMDALTGVAPEPVQKALGESSRLNKAPSVAGIVPALSYADRALKAASEVDNLKAWGKTMPFNNVPYLAPVVNALPDDLVDF